MPARKKQMQPKRNLISRTPVFVWRSSAETTSQGPDCRHCKFYIAGARPAELTGERERYFDIFETTSSKYRGDPYWDEHLNTGEGASFAWNVYQLSCPRCGWWASGVTNFNGEQFERVIEAGLREFEINDGRLAIKEVVSHVSKRSEDIYTLTPRKFEEVVASVYSSIGWRAELTKQTRDGGVDIICMKNSSGENCIIECKRYSRSRKVGIEAVDRLVGAAFRTSTKSAHLVTTSSFSTPAVKAKKQAAEQGLELELVDGCDLLKLVGAFSDPNLSVSDIEKIYSDR
jgi:hypothetical protein